ncbi:MAG TPA: TetR/AcrR family transcriptional regulator C-terminal domain-containing protein [Candidatus Merdivicinus intestinavium]|nr:TetR/AcrR family transcriptional regulator C-terminal domain-containing protein [Candidatus Merdivicinus intestinavium]
MWCLLADSNITKRALASALKELMETEPFEKISIGEICEKCEMNRKSFYYHFRDKYDLVNWICETEFIAAARRKEYASGWELAEELCAYLYDNRSFYRKTLRIDGQNSFSDYFRQVVALILSDQMKEILGETDPPDFFVDFYTDALICAVKRWLTEKDRLPPGEFAGLLKKCLRMLPPETQDRIS